MTTTSQTPEGVDLKNLRPGSLIDVETTSRHYHIECLGGDAVRPGQAHDRDSTA
jgi:hypothetical protein